MGGGKRAAIPVLALVFGLIAAGLSFLAYAKRIKVGDVRTDSEGYCIYSSSSAFALGLLAALFILIHQILISAGTACFCCGRKFPANFCGIISFILFLLSWASFVITFTGLLLTAIMNDSGLLSTKKYRVSTGKKDCLMGRETLFLGAAIWCVITMFFNLTSYATLMCASRKHHFDRPSFAA